MKHIYLVLLTVAPHLAFAQTPDSTYIHPQQFLLEETVVAANRWEQPLREVPGRVAKVGASLVAFQNPQTAADLLALSNQVFIQKSQLGGGSPMIRGFATNRVLLVVDGVRMNNAIFRSGNLQNVISLDANIIQSSEVIFGPGSVIYGSDAIGGVMDFHTFAPQVRQTGDKSFAGSAFTRYASANNEKTAHVDFKIALDKWAFLTSATYSDFGDLKMGANGPDAYLRKDYVVNENGTDVVKINSDPEMQIPTGYNQMNLMQKIRFQPSANLAFTYAFHFSETSDYSRYDRLILREDDALANAEWYYGPQQWIMNSLTVKHGSATAISDHISIVGAYQHYEESRHNRGVGSARRTNRFEEVNALSLNIDIDKKLGDNVAFFYGAEAVGNTVGSTAYREHIGNGEITGVSTRYPDGSSWQSYAAYISAKVRLSNTWLLNLSNRFNYVYTHASFDKTYFDFPFDDAALRNKALNGALGLTYNPSGKSRVYLNASTGFRSPNVDDIGKVFDSEPGNVVVPNPDLNPEQAYNIEAGGAGTLGKNFYFDLSVFYTTIDNAIARGPSTFNGQDSIDYDGQLSRVLSLQNISKVHVYGLQAGINWQLNNYFKLTSSLNWQRGKEKDPETNRNYAPTHVAPLFGATHVIFKKEKLLIDCYANYNGEITYANLALSERADSHLYLADDDGNPYAPSWWTLNLKASYQFLPQLGLNAGVENIADKRYRPYSSGIVSPGRNFIATLRFTW